MIEYKTRDILAIVEGHLREAFGDLCLKAPPSMEYVLSPHYVFAGALRQIECNGIETISMAQGVRLRRLSLQALEEYKRQNDVVADHDWSGFQPDQEATARWWQEEFGTHPSEHRQIFTQIVEPSLTGNDREKDQFMVLAFGIHVQRWMEESKEDRCLL